MIYQKNDLINYRLEKSRITLEEAKSLAKGEFWNGASNRLYYSCFYCVIALFAKDEVNATTHNGVRTEFFKKYIKTGLLDKYFSSLYSDLMGKREESDYDDFHDFSREEIEPLFEEVEKFHHAIAGLITKPIG